MYLARHGRGFLPADEESVNLHRKMGAGEVAEFEVQRVRSISWHRMYYGICTEIGKNQDPARDKNSIDNELRIRAGHFEVLFVEGREVRMPRRIAFAKLSAEKWAELWPSLDLAIREHFGEEYIRERAT
jgi:hypothetical protein